MLPGLWYSQSEDNKIILAKQSKHEKWYDIIPNFFIILCKEWSLWTAWAGCSVTCGDGVQSRNRTCEKGNCEGQKQETKSCSQRKCACKFMIITF